MAKKKLTEAQLADIREAFGLFDKNGDGNVSSEELGEVMKALGQCPSDSKLRDMMRQVDEDGDGTIDFDEFVKMMSERLICEEEVQRSRETQMRKAFAVFDKNGNGLIDSDELRQLMRSLGESLSDEDIEQMMREADKNEDGFVDFEEFAAVLSENVTSEKDDAF